MYTINIEPSRVNVTQKCVWTNINLNPMIWDARLGLFCFQNVFAKQWFERSTYIHHVVPKGSIVLYSCL